MPALRLLFVVTATVWTWSGSVVTVRGDRATTGTETRSAITLSTEESVRTASARPTCTHDGTRQQCTFGSRRAAFALYAHSYAANAHTYATSALQQFGSAVATARSKTGTGSGTQFIGMYLSMFKTCMKVCAACVCIAIIMKMLGKCNCGGKKCDCRRCKCLGKGLMYVGWDEFETFDVSVTIHSVQDVQNKSLIGDKQYKVKLNMSWSDFQTAPTQDMRWEQTKRLTVPQGAQETTISLHALGKFKDSKVASYTMETKKDMVDRGDDFWGQKQKLKLENKGKPVGTLLVTFRRMGDGGDPGPDGAGGGGMGDVPVGGIDSEGSLAVELMQAMEELKATPGFVPPASGKYEGDLKVALLARVLTGSLRVINKKGKEEGSVFIKVRKCNFSELQGEDQKEELKKQKEKAAKKGLSAPEQKWYWVYYPDKKHAEKKPSYPDGFIPLMGITSVHRSPERTDQFILKYGDGVLIYRRESGKGLDTWVDGIDAAFHEARQAVKDKKHGAEKKADALKRMRVMHKQFQQPPQTEEQWKAWYNWFKEQNFDEDLIREFYQEVGPKQPQHPQQAHSKAHPTPKAHSPAPKAKQQPKHHK